jgi:archaellum component FlaC|tara:strand:+ start:127 stop:315 length:189 start_codon:yes stop_codon:yes gene_type:complete
MDNNNMFKEDIIVDIGNLTGGVKSHMDGEKYTLKQMLVRIEELEQTMSDIKYFLQNPKKLPY